MAALAKEFHGSMRTVKGDDLLMEGDSYPMVTMVAVARVVVVVVVVVVMAVFEAVWSLG